MPEQSIRVIVTGSRTWDRPEVVWSTLDALAAELAEVGQTELVLVHGAHFPRTDPMTGRLPLESADYLADLWCRHTGHPLAVRAERHPANWKRYRRGAGPRRNREMAAAGAALCLGFHRNDSPGTADMLRVAEEHDIPTKVIQYAELTGEAA